MKNKWLFDLLPVILFFVAFRLADIYVATVVAIATSAACGFPIALSGTLGYMVMGWWQGLPGGALAYLDLRALFTIVPMSMLFAPVGAHVAHRVPVPLLKRAFACLLFGLAGYMLVRAIRGA